MNHNTATALLVNLPRVVEVPLGFDVDLLLDVVAANERLPRDSQFGFLFADGRLTLRRKPDRMMFFESHCAIWIELPRLAGPNLTEWQSYCPEFSKIAHWEIERIRRQHQAGELREWLANLKAMVGAIGAAVNQWATTSP